MMVTEVAAADWRNRRRVGRGMGYLSAGNWLWDAKVSCQAVPPSSVMTWGLCLVDQAEHLPTHWSMSPPNSDVKDEW